MSNKSVFLLFTDLTVQNIYGRQSANKFYKITFKQSKERQRNKDFLGITA